MDERKLLRFKTHHDANRSKKRTKNKNADNIRQKLIMSLTPMLEKINKRDPETALELVNQQSKIQEEEKEREIGTFMKLK